MFNLLASWQEISEAFPYEQIKKPTISQLFFGRFAFKKGYSAPQVLEERSIPAAQIEQFCA
jgi:hypothetical protein